jgi:hypothetical protein
MLMTPSHATISRLRISGPLLSEAEIEETRKAIDWGIHKIWEKDDPSLRDVIWFCLQDAVSTMKRWPDRERGWLASADRSQWPEIVHSIQELYEAELQRLIDAKMSKEEAPPPRLTITDPTAKNRALTVLGWLRFVQGKNVRRDRQVVLALAGGASLKSIRHQLMTRVDTDRAVYMVRDKVLWHVARSIQNFLTFRISA